MHRTPSPWQNGWKKAPTFRGCRTRDWKAIHHMNLPRGTFHADLGVFLSFGVKGGGAAGSQVVDGFKMISNLANVGDSTHQLHLPNFSEHRGILEPLKPERESLGTEFYDALEVVLYPQESVPLARQTEDIIAWHTSQVRQHFLQQVFPALSNLKDQLEPLGTAGHRLRRPDDRRLPAIPPGPRRSRPARPRTRRPRTRNDRLRRTSQLNNQISTDGEQSSAPAVLSRTYM